jgi:hypothetical protein
LKLDNFVVSPRDHKGKEQAIFPEPVSVTVIDFGRSLDLDAYSTNTRFAFDDNSLDSFGNSARDFVPGSQWISKSGWVYELDMHALAAFMLRVTQSSLTTDSTLMAHQKACRDKKCAIDLELCSKLRFTRGWDQKLWSSFIADMLNPQRGDSPPPSKYFINFGLIKL